MVDEVMQGLLDGVNSLRNIPSQIILSREWFEEMRSLVLSKRPKKPRSLAYVIARNNYISLLRAEKLRNRFIEKEESRKRLQEEEATLLIKKRRCIESAINGIPQEKFNGVKAEWVEVVVLYCLEGLTYEEIHRQFPSKTIVNLRMYKTRGTRFILKSVPVEQRDSLQKALRSRVPRRLLYEI